MLRCCQNDVVVVDDDIAVDVAVDVDVASDFVVDVDYCRISVMLMLVMGDRSASNDGGSCS